MARGLYAYLTLDVMGRDFATWLFDNARPLSVSAVTKANKPAICIREVDDEATVVLQYPSAQVVIQPSWNWPFSRKDMEIMGRREY